MTLVVCIDNRGGMLFNNRRVSRDKVIIERILDATKKRNKDLKAGYYSKELFNIINIQYKVQITYLTEEQILQLSKDSNKNTVLFIENIEITPEFLSKFKRVVIYKWNRDYPYDTKLDLGLIYRNYTLVSTGEFKGNSHERITEEIYQNQQQEYNYGG